MSRLSDIRRFYEILREAQDRLGGQLRLAQCHGRMQWPTRGVYFFFENGEERSTSGSGPRVVRIGTHALRPTSRTTLWHRLVQHRGVAKTGGGNHRGSIFRVLVGDALARRDGVLAHTWGQGSSWGEAATKFGMSRAAVQKAEIPLEATVSHVIGAMPFLFVAVDDPPGGESMRAVIESNAISLLSNFAKSSIDPPSSGWLGLHSGRERVLMSGLWNNKHVDEAYDPKFLDVLAQACAKTVAA